MCIFYKIGYVKELKIFKIKGAKRDLKKNGTNKVPFYPTIYLINFF